MNRCPSDAPTKCPSKAEVGTSYGSLEDIVKKYLKSDSKREGEYLNYYAKQTTLKDAITKAAMAEVEGGGKFSHQWRIPRAVLAKAKDALLNVKSDLACCKTFEELHVLVNLTIRPIEGIGELTVYDTAHRLGGYLKLAPEYVYLHAGVRAGVRALGLAYRSQKLPLSAFPKAFQKLKPEQVEDCLCIYKSKLEDWALHNGYSNGGKL